MENAPAGCCAAVSCAPRGLHVFLLRTVRARVRVLAVKASGCSIWRLFSCSTVFYYMRVCHVQQHCPISEGERHWLCFCIVETVFIRPVLASLSAVLTQKPFPPPPPPVVSRPHSVTRRTRTPSPRSVTPAARKCSTRGESTTGRFSRTRSWPSGRPRATPNDLVDGGGSPQV